MNVNMCQRHVDLKDLKGLGMKVALGLSEKSLAWKLRATGMENFPEATQLAWGKYTSSKEEISRFRSQKDPRRKSFLETCRTV